MARKKINQELLPPERGPDPPGELMAASQGLDLRATLRNQHPIHDLFGDVFERLGGVNGLEEWANDNPTDFYRMFVKMAPAPQGNAQSGAIVIQIHNQLGPSPLD